MMLRQLGRLRASAIRQYKLSTPKLPFSTDHKSHSKFEDSDVVGIPNQDPSLIATTFEQAAGLERLELLGKLANRSPFLMDPLKVDHYGTLKDPIMVDSVEGRRIVGCTGYPKESHQMLYFWVDEAEGPMRCQDCGQAFKINKLV